MTLFPPTIDGRLFVGSPHQNAWPRTTQDAPDPGAGTMGAQYSVGPGKRGETMFVQPAFAVVRGMPARHSQPDIPRELYETSGGALPTFFPVGNRAAETVHAAQGLHAMPYFLLVPPDRFNALANSKGGNRRGAHDVRNIARNSSGTVAGSRRRVLGIPVGS
jgi:hypothetical protein